jgi:adenine-specific DNA-methyltransferase
MGHRSGAPRNFELEFAKSADCGWAGVEMGQTLAAKEKEAGPTADALVASEALAASLSSFKYHALEEAEGRAAEEAFSLWTETASAASGGDDDRETFASEAAFAAAARLALETRLDVAGLELASLFPHLYTSPLFSWYIPDEQSRAELGRALEIGIAASPNELLGWLYQFSIPEPARKRFGHFYTSSEIVRSMLDSVHFDGPEILGRRFIDPAVGAGAYAIEATRRVIATAEEEDLGGVEICRTVQRVVHGLDLNPLGILLTEAAISMLLAPHLVEAAGEELEPLHLYVTDSLSRGSFAGEAHGDIAEHIKCRTGDYADGFDCVVANPPYAKHPSRLLSDEQKKRFSATTYGHPNLYGLFLQVGVELLADGGRLAFINPKSFVSGLYFRNLRRFLEQELDLQGFDSFDRRTGLFDGVLQDVVILNGQRRSSRVRKIDLREFAGVPTEKPQSSIQVARKSVLLDECLDYAFFISADGLAHRLLAKMTDSTTSLKDLGFEAVTGTIVWNRLKEEMRDAKEAEALPLIWGNGIRAYRFAGVGNRHGKATHVALVDKTKGIVSSGDALLVKRMTAKEEPRRLVACRIPEALAKSRAGYFAENHVNIVRPTSGAKIGLDAVLGLLNSTLYDYVFRSLNGNTQVSATELEMLPIKGGPELEAIAAQARVVSTEGQSNRARLERIDRLVARLFDLDAEDIECLGESYRLAA